MVEHHGIAPCTPARKAGVYLSTPMLEKMKSPAEPQLEERRLESRVRVALTCAVLQTAAWLLGQRDILN